MGYDLLIVKMKSWDLGYEQIIDPFHGYKIWISAMIMKTPSKAVAYLLSWKIGWILRFMLLFL